MVVIIIVGNLAEVTAEIFYVVIFPNGTVVLVRVTFKYIASAKNTSGTRAMASTKNTKMLSYFLL